MGIQKGLFTLVFLKPPEPFPTSIKLKEYSIGLELQPQTPSGGYKIFKVSERSVYVGVFATPGTVSYTNKMERVFNWASWALWAATADSLLGIKRSGFESRQ